MNLPKTHIDVRSDNFPLTKAELEKWDGQIGGELLAQYLSDQFNYYQLPIAGFHDEDWGYHLSFVDENYKHIFIGCNRYERDDNLFLIFINPATPIIKKNFFKKIDISKQLNHVSEILEKIILNSTIFQNTRWWSLEEMKTVL